MKGGKSRDQRRKGRESMEDLREEQLLKNEGRVGMESRDRKK
jgi:hypothetical protein